MASKDLTLSNSRVLTFSRVVIVTLLLLIPQIIRSKIVQYLNRLKVPIPRYILNMLAVASAPTPFAGSAASNTSTASSEQTSQPVTNPQSPLDTWQTYTPSPELLTRLDSLPITIHLRASEKTEELPWHIHPIPPLISHKSDWSTHLLRGALLNNPHGIPHALTFTVPSQKAVIFVAHLSTHICGHRSIVHGGLISSIFDDLMGSAFFMFAKAKGGYTANLNVDYRNLMKAGRTVVFVAWVVAAEGRKVQLRAEARDAEGWVSGWGSLNGELVSEVVEEGRDIGFGERILGKECTLYAESRSLFIIPRPEPKADTVAKAE